VIYKCINFLLNSRPPSPHRFQIRVPEENVLFPEDTVLWDVTPWSMVEVHLSFGGIYSFQLQFLISSQAKLGGNLTY
jgi:hypothetical protein